MKAKFHSGIRQILAIAPYLIIGLGVILKTAIFLGNRILVRELETYKKYAKTVQVRSFPGGSICVVTK